MDLFKVPANADAQDSRQKAACDNNAQSSGSSMQMPPPRLSLHRASSFESPRVRALRNFSMQDFISPSKEGEVPMDYSPCAKSPAALPVVTPSGTGVGDTMKMRGFLSKTKSPLATEQLLAGSHSDLPNPIIPHKSTNFSNNACLSSQQHTDTNGSDSIQPGGSGASGSTIHPDPLPLLSDSDSETEANKSQDMDPGYIFRMSPGSPPYERDYQPTYQPGTEVFQISMPPQKEETNSEKMRRLGVRRWHSQEQRKRLFDMSNTPPSAYSSRRSLFKRPNEVDVTTPMKRPKEGASEEDPDQGSSSSETIQVEAACSPQTIVNQERIKSAVESLQCQDLIADGSRNYCLPVVSGKHSDLKNIEPITLAELLMGKFADMYDKVTIIDCRYPYEYNGGHIKGAINIYTEHEMLDFLNAEFSDMEMATNKHILVFHCEFSSQRAPSLLRHLRKCDREQNLHQYPQLTFPEVYCLFGGYKEFFSNHPDLCEPSSYIPMNDENYTKEFRHFRGKAKTWTAGDRSRRK